MLAGLKAGRRAEPRRPRRPIGLHARGAGSVFARFLLQAEEFLKLPVRFFLADPVALLDLTDKLIALSLDLSQVAVRQLAPSLLYSAALASGYRFGRDR